MHPRIFGILSVFVLSVFASPAFCGGDKKAKRPNIIVIIADDVGWNDIGCYGHPKVRTPNLDKMAKAGLRFNAAFLTTSSCSPSRCSIMTGRYPHSTGAGELHQPLPADQTVFAGLLKRAGYFCVSAGKWHLGQPARANFDRVVGGGKSGCDQWVNMLKARPKDKPFFMWFAAIDAHRPYQKKTIANPHTEKDAVVPPFFPDNSAVRKDLALYYDEISRMDDFIGQVFAELTRQGVADNTLVIFMSDNGRPFPRCKTTLYDSGIRTPFLVQWPGRTPRGATTNSLISAVDIAPTLLEVAGLKAPKSMQGKSFAKILTNPKAEIRDHIVAEHNWHDYKAHKRAVRSSRYLYVWNAFPELSMSPPADAVRSPTYASMMKLEKAGKLKPHQRQCFTTSRPREELYDLKSDPYCLKNLANSKKHLDQLLEMRRQLEVWTIATADEVPSQPTPDKFHRVTGQRLGRKK